MPSKHQPEPKPGSMPSVAERKQIFLEAFARLGVTADARREAGITRQTLWHWRCTDTNFHEAFKALKRVNAGETAPLPPVNARETASLPLANAGETAPLPPVNARETAPLPLANAGETAPLPSADKPARNLSPEDRRQIFLDNFAEIGALTLACDAAGVDLRTLNDWLQAERGFREAFNEAKLRYRDRLQSLAMRQITEERDGPMLRFTLQAEFPEKYGKPGKMSKDRPGLTWSDLERMAGEARRLNDAAAPL